MRGLIVDAIAYFNDTSIDGRTRVGAKEIDENYRPKFRMNNAQQLSLYFPNPPPIMVKLYNRLSFLIQVHANNIEAIYHVYAPRTLPINLHMDNFNRFLYPHRYGSVSMFFDEMKDGGTVFPLLACQLQGFSNFGREHQQIERWHYLVNASRMDPDGRDGGYSFRRVESDEADPFRKKTLDMAIEMCENGRAAQQPVVPEMGTAYMWRNYDRKGEDDVRTVHAGCGSSQGLKIIGTFFIRDGPGPFQEQSNFWDLWEPVKDLEEENRRLVEAQSLHYFRLNHMHLLYSSQREVARILGGEKAANELEQMQTKHEESLIVGDTALSVNENLVRLRSLLKDHPWQKILPPEVMF